MGNKHINHKLRFLMPFLLILPLFWSCMDLEETPYDVVTPGEYYQTEGELIAAVIPVYNSLWLAYTGALTQLQVSSDAMFIPTRGGDWDDGGMYRRLQLHTWTPVHPSLGNTWEGAYGGVARANDMLARLEETTSESELIPTFKAEVRVLRALYYWWLIDLFGDVPLVTDPATDPDNPPSQSTRTEVFDFIVAEITAALPDLKDSFAAGSYGRVTKGAANTLLATVYLNAGVYTGTPKWSECVAACDAVINSGEYALMPTVADVFALENEGPGNTEYILVVAALPLDGVSAQRHMMTLHYNQIPASPWNGYAVLAEFYNKYDADDDRLDQILVGQAYVLAGPNAGDPAFDRSVPPKPLIFTVESPLFDASEAHGPRVLKWPIDPDMSGWFAGNDYAIFRYSHVLLAKAEAEFNLSGGGLASLNLVHERAGLDALGSITADDIFDERGYEFLWEGFRRQDQIRMGYWDGTWSLHDTPTAEFTEIFPIPQTQMDANPNLVQNPGY